MAQRNDELYAQVTERVLTALRDGTVPWRRSWSAIGLQRNLQRERPYRGINQLLLLLEQIEHGYGSPYWTTYRAAAKAGGHVRKGEHGTRVILWKFKERKDEDDPEQTRRIPLLRHYTVFNLDQTKGLEAPEQVTETFEPIERCEQIVAEMPSAPRIVHGDPAYLPALDTVALPEPGAFEAAEQYYAAAFHELVHSTAHASRLGREIGTADPITYAREELIAELGAAMLCAVAHIEPRTIDNAAAYIASWINALEDDPRMVVVASGAAQRAADFILDVDPAEEAAVDEKVAAAR